MLDADDRVTLEQVRKAGESSPAWTDHWFCYVLIAFGLALGIWDVVDGVRPGASAGLFVGWGLGLLMVAWPLSRYALRCHRLIRHADEAGAFDA